MNSIIEFYEEFKSEESCYKFIEKVYQSNRICPICEHDKVYITNRGYRCAPSKVSCGKKFTVKTNTVFENTKIPLSIWFFYIFSQCINGKNTSSRQWSKNINITQKTTWTMSHVIRSVLKQDDEIRFSGIVEVDEAFLGKRKNRWTRWGSISTRKEPILGLFERKTGRVILKGIPDRRQETVLKLIHRYVENGSTIYSDGNQIYNKVVPDYKHESVVHSEREYVRGGVHTNNIENVWGQLKRNIRGIHHSVSGQHVQVYLDELAYRINNRHLTPMEKFLDIIKRCKK